MRKQEIFFYSVHSHRIISCWFYLCVYLEKKKITCLFDKNYDFSTEILRFCHQNSFPIDQQQNRRKFTCSYPRINSSSKNKILLSILCIPFRCSDAPISTDCAKKMISFENQRNCLQSQIFLEKKMKNLDQPPHKQIITQYFLTSVPSSFFFYPQLLISSPRIQSNICLQLKETLFFLRLLGRTVDWLAYEFNCVYLLEIGSFCLLFSELKFETTFSVEFLLTVSEHYLFCSQSINRIDGFGRKKPTESHPIFIKSRI